MYQSQKKQPRKLWATADTKDSNPTNEALEARAIVAKAKE
jgi:hypothetical protein